MYIENAIIYIIFNIFVQKRDANPILVKQDLTKANNTCMKRRQMQGS